MIPILIVGHQARRHMIDRLHDRFPTARAFVDDGTLGGWGNHRRALTWAADHATGPVLVLEDDAIPSASLERDVDDLLAVFPDRLISLYAGTGYPAWAQKSYPLLMEDAARQGRGWFELGALCHAVGYIIPTEGLRDFLTEADKGVIGTDERLDRTWTVRDGRPIVYAHPSLVDHADETPVEQHFDGQPRRLARRAHAFRG